MSDESLLKTEMGTRTFCLDIMYKSGTEVCFFPCTGGFILGKEGGRKGVMHHFLICLWFKGCSDGGGHKGISCAFQLKERKETSLSLPLSTPPSPSSPPTYFSFANFKKKIKFKEIFPNSHLSLLHLKTKTVEHLKYHIKTQGAQHFSSWAPITKDYSWGLRYPSSNVQPYRKIHCR